LNFEFQTIAKIKSNKTEFVYEVKVDGKKIGEWATVLSVCDHIDKYLLKKGLKNDKMSALQTRKKRVPLWTW
jgi:hypothetical protein